MFPFLEVVEPSVIYWWKLIKFILCVNLIFIALFDFSKVLIVANRPGFGRVLEVAERVPMEGKFIRREVVLILSPLLFHFLVKDLYFASTVYFLPQWHESIDAAF
jgi:hypothetical protein